MKNGQSEKLLVFKEQAFPHTDELYRFGLSLTGNPADTDELVHETYVKAYQFWDTYEHGPDTRAWLFRILKNSYVNAYRQETKNTG